MDPITEIYATTLKSSIDDNFATLDTVLDQCERQKALRQAYQKALRDLESGLDYVSRYFGFFQKKAENALKNYSEISRQLAPYVCDRYNTLEPWSVGIFGSWGSGKTRLLRAIKNLYETDLTDHKGEGEKDKPSIVPIFFNAWRFEKEPHVIIPLFQTMLAELQNYPEIGRIRRVKERLTILALALVSNLSPGNALSAAKDISLSSLASVVDWKGVIKNYQKHIARSDPETIVDTIIQSGYLNAVYIQIPQWIEKITIQDNVRFVFLIDDLDRCLPENALKMLESIKLFLDVPGCAFVLAVDDDVIERGVEHHYREYLFHGRGGHSSQATAYQIHLPITGDEYLEKMVQLPFHIPSYDHEDTRTIITDRFPRFAEAWSYTPPERTDPSKGDEIDHKKQRDKLLLDFFVHNTPKKPRKIIRAVELYLAKEKLLRKRGISIRTVLLAKLTLLELFAPRLYRFMQERGFRDKFETLVTWKKDYESLSNTQKIRDELEKSPRTPQEDHEEDLHLVSILRSFYAQRVRFSLDGIFDERYDETTLVEHAAAKPISYETKQTAPVHRPVSPIDWESFFARLLGPDERAWRRAFDDEAFTEPGSVLDAESFAELMRRLAEHQDLIRDPRWLEIVAHHLNDDDFLMMLTTYKPLEVMQ